ncbi:hypothetical protein WN48_00051 [Eufriesea mexicana]|nr:hypothetical protein WN48_00051 [Eufriesea mexicana]
MKKKKTRKESIQQRKGKMEVQEKLIPNHRERKPKTQHAEEDHKENRRTERSSEAKSRDASNRKARKAKPVGQEEDQVGE